MKMKGEFINRVLAYLFDGKTILINPNISIKEVKYDGDWDVQFDNTFEYFDRVYKKHIAKYEFGVIKVKCKSIRRCWK